jgi:hypothetical protein
MNALLMTLLLGKRLNDMRASSLELHESHAGGGIDVDRVPPPAPD